MGEELDFADTEESKVILMFPDKTDREIAAIEKDMEKLKKRKENEKSFYYQPT